MDYEPQTREVISEPPTDVEAPEIYNRTVLILGAVSVLVVLGLIGLAAFQREIGEGLVAIGAAAVGGLVALLTPKR